MEECSVVSLVLHEDNSATLINDDCFAVLKLLKPKSIDLIICDLPYGVTQHKKDIPLPLDRLWKEYCRVIKDNGAILLFGQGKFYVDLVNSNPGMFRYDLVWDKNLTTGFLNARRMPLRQHEQIAVFYKKRPVYHPQFTEGKPLHGRGSAYKTKEIKNSNYGEFGVIEDTRKGETAKYPTSIIRIPKNHPSKARHRTEKPVELLEWLIRTYSDPGDTVLDNCMGSGSAAVAALKCNRNFYGIELDSDIYESAVETVKNAVRTEFSDYTRKVTE